MFLLGLLLKPVAYASLPALALHYAAQKSPIARYYVRLGVYLSTMGVCSIWGVIVSIGMALVGEKYNANFVTARSFYYLAGYILDIRFEVEGEEYLENRPAVLVGNHQSMLDILYLGRIFPKRASIMAKKELQWMPLLGQYMTFSGAVFVDRGNNIRAVQSLRAAGDTIKAQSTSLWMFPEGTRSLKQVPDLLPFKKGAFHLAVQSGLPIIPVVCENYWRIYHQGVFEPGVLKIKVLPPISTADLTTDDIGELAARVREQMITTLRSMSSTIEPSAPAPKQAAPRAQSPPRPPSPQDEPKTMIDERVLYDPRDKEKTPGPRERDVSHESLYSSSASEARLTQASEAETEEDEGMILVGRPGKSSDV